MTAVTGDWRTPSAGSPPRQNAAPAAKNMQNDNVMVGLGMAMVLLHAGKLENKTTSLDEYSTGAFLIRHVYS
jgi:hypothetical protein